MFCEFLEESAHLAQEIVQSILGPVVLPSSNCALHNPNSQQLDWTVYCIVLGVNQPPSSMDYALCSLGSRSPKLLAEIAQPS